MSDAEQASRCHAIVVAALTEAAVDYKATLDAIPGRLIDGRPGTLGWKLLVEVRMPRVGASQEFMGGRVDGLDAAENMLNGLADRADLYVAAGFQEILRAAAIRARSTP